LRSAPPRLGRALCSCLPTPWSISLLLALTKPSIPSTGCRLQQQRRRDALANAAANDRKINAAAAKARLCRAASDINEMRVMRRMWVCAGLPA
jgi:hypothetical protein